MRAVLALWVCSTLLWAGCSYTPQSDVPMASQEVTGAQLFEANCASCHGMQGKSQSGMFAGKRIDFTSESWQKLHTDDGLKNVITQGRGMMPAFKGALSDKELEMLIQHIRSLKPAL